MGNSRAYPVYRSSDPLDVYAQAKRLCALLDSRDAGARVGAELRTVADVQRMVKLLPDMSYDPDRALTDPVTGDYLFFTGRTLPVDPVELESLLPLLLNDEFASGATFPTGPSPVEMFGVDQTGCLPASRRRIVRFFGNSHEVASVSSDHEGTR
ncbi:hypothetical protein OH809_18835 [Streptomyces sp. NBC_00873]|uniref:hypothetical protein n=1 Tax=unclassified Streptomyces TaxID=2593676 RepID=UPI00386A516E|nr:hypothetical protein OH809_18835 [Streptomyces sp. NBC_00873]WTA45439.1 hypothetical protein OH821_24855 [Streptomyces sp. NBC_00842]